MKEQNMSVNESVFHSLITGHCKSGDIEAAKGVMTIMGEAGLDTGNEAHMAFILGIVAGDQPWSAIKEHMTELNDKGIFFNDSDYFSLIVVLIRKGFKEGAVELSTALPKKSGFFQEMRNALPQMILAGEVDLPFSILSEFQGPHLNYETHTEATTRDHGLFILRAMVNADYPADKVVEMLEKIASNNTDTLTRYLSRCLENYIQLDKREQCLEFVEVAKTKHGSDFLRPGLYHGWIRAQCSRLADSTEDMLQFLLKLEGNGINVNVTNLSQDFLPHLVDKSENLGSGLVMIKKAADAQGIRLGWGKLSTAGVQYMLNKDTEEAFSAVASFLVAINVPSRPLAWYASLGRNYLITDDLHSLKTILFLSSNTYEKFKAKATTFDEINDTYLFRSLCHIHRQCHRFKPQEDPDLVLDIVLKELQQQKIGITSEVAAELTLLIQDVTVKDRVAMLEEYYKDSDNNWTNERTKKYLDHLKSGRVYQRLSVNSDFIPMDRDGRITDGDFPSDIKGLEKAFDIVSKKNRFNMKL
jgi:pentatricopeptide repeat protein